MQEEQKWVCSLMGIVDSEFWELGWCKYVWENQGERLH